MAEHGVVPRTQRIPLFDNIFAGRFVNARYSYAIPFSVYEQLFLNLHFGDFDIEVQSLAGHRTIKVADYRRTFGS